VCRKNANVAIPDRDGLLALHHAVLCSNQHIVNLLLSHTAALTVGALHCNQHTPALTVGALHCNQHTAALTVGALHCNQHTAALMVGALHCLGVSEKVNTATITKRAKIPYSS